MEANEIINKAFMGINLISSCPFGQKICSMCPNRDICLDPIVGKVLSHLKTKISYEHN